MYMYSLVSVFCSHHFSAKQLKCEIYIILSQISLGFYNKTIFGEINILDCNFLSSSNGNDPKKCEVWRIYQLNMVLFLQLIG